MTWRKRPKGFLNVLIGADETVSVLAADVRAADLTIRTNQGRIGGGFGWSMHYLHRPAGPTLFLKPGYALRPLFAGHGPEPLNFAFQIARRAELRRYS